MLEECWSLLLCLAEQNPAFSEGLFNHVVRTTLTQAYGGAIGLLMRRVDRVWGGSHEGKLIEKLSTLLLLFWSDSRHSREAAR